MGDLSGMWYNDAMKEIIVEMYCEPCRFKPGSAFCMVCKYDTSNWLDEAAIRKLTEGLRPM